MHGAGGHRTRRAWGGAGGACPCFLPEGSQGLRRSRPARRAVAAAMPRRKPDSYVIEWARVHAGARLGVMDGARLRVAAGHI